MHFFSAFHGYKCITELSLMQKENKHSLIKQLQHNITDACVVLGDEATSVMYFISEDLLIVRSLKVIWSETFLRFLHSVVEEVFRLLT